MTYQTSNNNQAWTTKQLIALSDSLAIAYNNDAASTKTNQNKDNWTTEQLIQMSNSFSDAYGSGL